MRFTVNHAANIGDGHLDPATSLTPAALLVRWSAARNDPSVMPRKRTHRLAAIREGDTAHHILRSENAQDPVACMFRLRHTAGKYLSAPHCDVTVSRRLI